KEVEAKVAPLRKRMSEVEAPYRKDLLEKKTMMLTPAERAVLAVAEKDRTPVQKKLAEGTKKALNTTWEEVAAAFAASREHHAQPEALTRAIHQVQATLPRPPAKAMALIDQDKKAPDTFVLRRGEPNNKGPKVEPRPPGILLASQPTDAFC